MKAFHAFIFHLQKSYNFITTWSLQREAEADQWGFPKAHSNKSRIWLTNTLWHVITLLGFKWCLVSLYIQGFTFCNFWQQSENSINKGSSSSFMKVIIIMKTISIAQRFQIVKWSTSFVRHYWNLNQLILKPYAFRISHMMIW